MAIARGNAQAVREEKKLNAEVLVAYFRKEKDEKSTIHRIEAFNKVKVETPKDTALSDRGVYNVKAGLRPWSVQ